MEAVLLLDASFAKQRARLGGLARSAKYDGREVTLKARLGLRASFLEQVDPSGELRKADPAEAERRADAAWKLHFARLAFASAKARKKPA